MDKKYFIGLTCLSLSLLAKATSEDVDMTPGAPGTSGPDPQEKPPLPIKVPARAPQVTITDGTLLTVGRVAEDASILLEILRDGEPFFSTFTLEHSIAIPFLEPGHTYTINLTVNGTLWTGTYE